MPKKGRKCIGQRRPRRDKATLAKKAEKKKESECADNKTQTIQEHCYASSSNNVSQRDKATLAKKAKQKKKSECADNKTKTVQEHASSSNNVSPLESHHDSLEATLSASTSNSVSLSNSVHTCISPEISLQNSSIPSPSHVDRQSVRIFCGYTGNFTSCDCIVHEDGVSGDNSLQAAKDTLQDSWSDDADQFFFIYNTKSYEHSPADDLDKLAFNCLQQEALNNLQHEQVVNNFGFNIIRSRTDKLHYVKMYEHESVTVSISLTINCDMSPLITVHEKPLRNHEAYKGVSSVLHLSDILLLLESISDYVVCSGNPDSQFIEHYGFKGESFLENYSSTEYNATIRSNTCTFLTKRTFRCENCMKTRRVLANKELRLANQDQNVVLSSSRPNSSLSRDQLLEKNKLMKNKLREAERQNKRLKAKVLLAKEGFEANLTEPDQVEIDNLVTECQPNLENVFPDPDSFERIFWEEQLKYNQLRNKSSMRWHPLIIKWSLLIRSKSSKAYQAMREQGFIHLPSDRTLYDYSHYLPSKLGFVPESVDMLVTECQKKGMFSAEWSSYVGILQDEIKVKDDLVYCPTTGQLIGYVNLDDISNQILDIEKGNQQASRDLATSALVIMVRGITTNLKFPLAAFATRGLDSSQLFTILWRVIELLEDRGLKVLFITCDGASQNRKFFEMHRMNDSDEPVNSTPNPYAEDGRQLYFISDVPHLLKTARNCFANSNSHKKSRMLWKGGYNILWTHIVDLFTYHIENKLYTKSKLTEAHVRLTPFSCMKVNLAAQVLSRKVAIHLESVYGEEVRETVRFIKHMNKFFDCLNVRNLYEGNDTGNHDLDAYTDANDPRLQYLEETFLGYFNEWQSSVTSRPGNFSNQERLKMQLSQQTIDGFKITVRSIVACVRHILQQGAPFVLTEVFNQDVLEQHFGHYRHKGGACNNPTVNDVRHTMNVLRTVGSSALAPLRGNTKRRHDASELSSDCHDSLPRKKSRPSL